MSIGKVLVIGDSCSDVFVYGRCDRLSPEAPVPVFIPLRTMGNGGMSINVFENLKVLGVECDIITNDMRPVKTRYVDEVSNQLLLRIDTNDSVKQIKGSVLDKIDFSNYEIVVISDYNKGYLSEANIKYILKKHKKVFIDSKKKFDSWCDGAFVIKINEKEYIENGNYLIENSNKFNLIVSKGKRGASLHNSLNDVLDFNIIEEHDIRDLSGAGDTFLAGLVANYIKNSDICTAIEFANKCASYVVTQKGVVVVDINKFVI